MSKMNLFKNGGAIPTKQPKALPVKQAPAAYPGLNPLQAKQPSQGGYSTDFELSPTSYPGMADQSAASSYAFPDVSASLKQVACPLDIIV